MSDLNTTLTGFTAGTVAPEAALDGPVNAINELQEQWATYVPVLSNWALGNGTISGRYRRVGKTIDVEIDLTLGSTSTMVGTFHVSLPFTQRAPFTGRPVNGWVMCQDAAPAALAYLTPTLNAGGSAINARSAAGVLATGASPFAFATGDRVVAIFRFEAA